MALVIQVKGDAKVDEVFAEIDKLLDSSLAKKTENVASAWARGNMRQLHMILVAHDKPWMLVAHDACAVEASEFWFRDCCKWQTMNVSDKTTDCKL